MPTHKNTHSPTKDAANARINRPADPSVTPQPQRTLGTFSDSTTGTAATVAATWTEATPAQYNWIISHHHRVAASFQRLNQIASTVPVAKHNYPV